MERRSASSPTNQAGGRPFPLRGRLLGLPTLVSFALAVAFIVFLLTRFDIDVAGTWRLVTESRPGLFVLALALYYLTFPLRGYRWRLLMANAGAFEGATRPPPSLRLFSETILLSWFVNSISWFRLGDAYRAYLVADRAGSSFSRSIGTVAAERVLDIVVVFVLLLWAGIGLLRSEEAGGVARGVVLAATVLAVLVLMALLGMRRFGERVARFLPGRAQPVYRRFQEGALGSFRQVPLLALLTVAIWLLEAARLYFVVQALQLEVGLSLVLFAALAHSLLTTIPLTPGGLGFVELGLTGLLALSLPRHEAVGVTLLDRSITYVSIVVLGGALFVARQAIDLRARMATRSGRSPRLLS